MTSEDRASALLRLNDDEFRAAVMAADRALCDARRRTEALAALVASKLDVHRSYRPDGTVYCTAPKWPGFHFILRHGEPDDAMRAALSEFLVLYARAAAATPPTT